MNRIFYYIGRLTSLLYPVWLHNKINIQLDKIYTWRIATSFKQFSGGSNTLIHRCIHVWNGKNITIGENIHIFKDSILACHPNSQHAKPEIIIGNDCEIGEYSHITCANRITIGNNLFTGRRCTITDNSHGPSSRNVLDQNPRLRDIVSKGPVSIGNNVWLGDNVVILPGVTVGDGVIIGANTVVTNNIPSYSVVVGNPMKIVKILKNG